MSLENSAEIQELMDESYTCISFESLQLRIPGSESSVEDVVRDYPCDPLVGRTPREREALRAQPFFSF